MRSCRRLSCTSMSDHAESQRMRNCTRLLYIPISAKAMTTRTPKKIQAMNVFLSRRSTNKRDGTIRAQRVQLKLMTCSRHLHQANEKPRFRVARPFSAAKNSRESLTALAAEETLDLPRPVRGEFRAFAS